MTYGKGCFKHEILNANLDDVTSCWIYDLIIDYSKYFTEVNVNFSRLLLDDSWQRLFKGWDAKCILTLMQKYSDFEVF